MGFAVGCGVGGGAADVGLVGPMAGDSVVGGSVSESAGRLVGGLVSGYFAGVASWIVGGSEASGNGLLLTAAVGTGVGRSVTGGRRAKTGTGTGVALGPGSAPPLRKHLQRCLTDSAATIAPPSTPGPSTLQRFLPRRSAAIQPRVATQSCLQRELAPLSNLVAASNFAVPPVAVLQHPDSTPQLPSAAGAGGCPACTARDSAPSGHKANANAAVTATVTAALAPRTRAILAVAVILRRGGRTARGWQPWQWGVATRVG